ncbi:MAG: hypothetical protein MJ162_00425 [Treponema sp.]|nr:hypothetical protein [Treponema sp.]
MKLYDKEIQKVQTIFSQLNPQVYSAEKPWPVSESEELILKSDMAVDLGGGEAYGISGILFTTKEDLVTENKVIVTGPSITESAKIEAEEVNYARFVIIKLKKSAVENKTTQQLYAIFRKIDYLRYHIFLEGYAMRISAVQHRESVRISKKAVSEGVEFDSVGAALIKAYCALPEVDSVQIYFCTSLKKTELFRQLDSISRKSNDITESLNEIFKGLKMDCNTCAQKPLCDEIEGLKELHLGKEK